jgi:F0F1-type ATP synthase assembly protein I
MTDDATEEPSEDDSSNEGPSRLVKAGIFSGLGFELVGMTVGGIVLGSYLDQKLGIEPIGFLVCLLASLAAVGFHIWLITERFLTRSDASEDGSTDA